ncbi:prohibitin family protein [Candidatus Saccharibacteria bacterium]|nr:MAG: prohibitin family protein [Candidatus Saccharibacteria bacterium]
MIKTAQIVGKPALLTKRNLTIFAIVLFILITIITSVRVVGTGQVGVVTQYGRVTGRELSEGMSLVLPWGLNNVTVYDIKVQKETVTSTAASQDLQDVSSEIVLNYQLERGSVSRVHQTIGAQYVDKIVTPAINEVFKAASAKYTASELITERSKLKAEAYNTLVNRLKPHGIQVSELSIVDFKFSSNFSKAIEEKQVAQQNAERAKFNLEAAKTDAEAQRAQSETLTQQYLQKQAIEKWDGKLPTYMGGGESVFNIPLR